MATTPSDCCTPCGSFVPPVNIPGTPGSDGTPGSSGANGVDSFTVTTQDFVVPAIGNNVTIFVANSTWMAVGQNIFITGAGNFSVVSKGSSTTATITYLNYAGNTNAGNNITAGAAVSPSGTQPTSLTLLPTISGYALAGSQVVTVTPSQGLSLQLTLGSAASYLLIATARFDFVGVTFAAHHVITAKLRRTNNTPADVANCIANYNADIVTTQTITVWSPTLPAVAYTPSAPGDTIEMLVSVDTLPGAGNVEMIEASILAIPLF